MQRQMLLAIAFAIAVLVGCGSSEEDLITGFDPPGLRSGPASVSGTFTISVPVVKVSSEPIASATGVSYCTWECPGRLGVFPLATDWPDGVVSLDEGGFMSADALSGVYAVDYNFAGIPLDTYELRLSGINLGDWGAYSYYTLLDSEAFTLTAADPDKTSLDWSLDFAESAEPCSISGAVLISGNPPFTKTAEVSLRRIVQSTEYAGLPAAGSEAAGLDEFTWYVPTGSAQDGRLFYEITNLPAGEYTGTSLIAESIPMESAYQSAAVGVLSAAQPNGRGDYYKRITSTPPDAGAINEGPHRHGTIRVDLTINNVTDWDGQLALIAERTTGWETKFHRAIAFVNPVYYRSSSGSDSFTQYLHYLEAGTYDIKLVRLGDTNTDEPEVLARFAAPVELVEPAPIAHPLKTGYWYEYPLPELDLELEVTLPGTV